MLNLKSLRTSITVLCAACLIFAALPGPASANGYAINAPLLCWSDDGEWLAAVVPGSWPPAGSPTDGELRLYDRFGRYQVLATGSVGSPSFNAEGALAAIVNNAALHFPIAYGPQAGVWAAEPVPLINDNTVLDLSYGAGFGNTGEVLYATAGERFYGSMVCVLRPGGELHQLVLPPDDGSVFGPAAAGTGALCYLQQPGLDDSAYERLMYLAQPNAAPVQLTRPRQREDEYHESNPLWLDDKHVLFQRGGWGDWHLYRIDIESQNEVIEANDAESPSLSADCRFLAFARRNPVAKAQFESDWELSAAVFIINRDSGHEQRLSLDGAGVDAQFPALTPDGKRIAWLQSDPSGIHVVVRSNPLAMK